MKYQFVIFYFLLSCCLFVFTQSVTSQKQLSFAELPCLNRYGMHLTKDKDGMYVINKKYGSFTEVAGLPDLLTPYAYVPQKIQESDYVNCITKRFIYKKHKGYELALEVDIPKREGSFPFIVYVHGGGWYNGTLDVFRKHSTYLASNGIAGVRIAYSLIPQGATYDQVIAEINEAFAFVISRAGELSLDTTRFGFAGGSAGAHLSAITAMKTRGCKLFIGIYGSYDLERRKPGDFPADNAMLTYLKAKEGDVLKKASAIYQIPDRNIPACLLVHGTCDTSIDYNQSIWFADALKNEGAFVDLVLYKGYEHSFTKPGVSDAYESLIEKMLSFSKQVFYRKRIACIGNSITYGALLENRKDAYPVRLQQKWGNRYDVCNLGVSGATLQFDKAKAYAKTSEYKSIAAYRPDVIILKLGANDARPAEWNGCDVFYKDYTKLIDDLLAVCPTIYLCTPTPPYGEKWKERDKILRKQLIPVLKKIAGERHLKLINLYEELPLKEDYYMEDGIHPTAMGYEIISDYICDKVKIN